MHFTSVKQTSQYKKDRDALNPGQSHENGTKSSWRWPWLDGHWRHLPISIPLKEMGHWIIKFINLIKKMRLWLIWRICWAEIWDLLKTSLKFMVSASSSSGFQSLFHAVFLESLSSRGERGTSIYSPTRETKGPIWLLIRRKLPLWLKSVKLDMEFQAPAEILVLSRESCWGKKRKP